MRQRRDAFARVTYVPRRIVPLPGHDGWCSWCGTGPVPRHPLYVVVVEHDGGRENTLSGAFCTWSCAESYHTGLDRSITKGRS